MITKTKARLVAKGFMQREGVDYLQTSAPTPAAASVKILMTVANEKGYKIYHLDVAQAFTKAELDFVIYISFRVVAMTCLARLCVSRRPYMV